MCKFHVFMIKTDFRNRSDSVEFRFEDNLK